jgi:hypothetical protein
MLSIIELQTLVDLYISIINGILIKTMSVEEYNLLTIINSNLLKIKESLPATTEDKLIKLNTEFNNINVSLLSYTWRVEISDLKDVKSKTDIILNVL